MARIKNLLSALLGLWLSSAAQISRSYLQRHGLVLGGLTLVEAAKLDTTIASNLKELGYGG